MNDTILLSLPRFMMNVGDVRSIAYEPIEKYLVVEKTSWEIFSYFGLTDIEANNLMETKDISILQKPGLFIKRLFTPNKPPKYGDSSKSIN